MKQDYNTPGLMKFANEAVVNKKAAKDWLTPLIATLAAGAGAKFNYDPNNKFESSAIGAIAAGGGVLSGHMAAEIPWIAAKASRRAGIMGASALGGEVFFPRIANKLTADSRLANQLNIESKARTNLLGEQIEALKNPLAPVSAPAPAPAPAPISISVPPSANNTNKDSTVTQSLGTKEYLGLGVLGAVGAYALYQLARSSKRKADGLENPPVTNVTIAGGSGGSGGSDSSAPPASVGTLRVTLPTKGKMDNETQVEMPLERIGLSNALLQKIRRDTKRKLRGESDSRTLHILPKEVVN